MYEWLVQEMAAVRTGKFFKVDGPMSAEKRTAIEQSEAPFPPSYFEFIFRFGNASLFRNGSQYRIQVFNTPEAIETADGDLRICFGRTEETSIFFKASQLVREAESPVFAWRHASKSQALIADGFEDWLCRSFSTAKRKYSKREWRAIENGPLPFDEREFAIVAARRLFSWRVAGIGDDGPIQFEVHNGSQLRLPFLSIGIQGKRRGTADGLLHGGIWLPVDSIQPGETKIIEKDCYLKWVDPHDVEAFAEPDPDPEDRDRYWEFRTPSGD